MRPTQDDMGVRVTMVIKGTPADRADIFVNDIIVKIDDTDVTDIASLRTAMGQFSIGDTATITAKRGKSNPKTKTFQLVLGDQKDLDPTAIRSRQQNSMGSTPSKRRKDFPLAFQHDSQLDAKNCGGPIVDLNGNVVGINIARDGRVSSFALPRSVVEPVIKRLKTGDYLPAVVNAKQIERIDQQLSKLQSRLDALPSKKSEMERKVGVANARREELERMKKDIEERLKSIEERAQLDEVELQTVDRELKNAHSTKRRLEKRRKKLATGAE